MADSNDPFLTPGEVADRLGVDSKTIARWARDGKIKASKTIGGHRRYRTSAVDELAQQLGVDN